MSPRNTAHPPRTATARPGKSVRSSLIVKDKKKKRSAQDQSALDDRFHRTNRASPARSRTAKSSKLRRSGLQDRVRCMRTLGDGRASSRLGKPSSAQ
jgi:hypothetical protein